MAKQKNIEVVLLPKDFKRTEYTSSSDCALARAVNRHFKTNTASVDEETVDINFLEDNHQSFKIKRKFTPDDFDFVAEQYQKDPKMTKGYYVVTLMPRKIR